MKLVEFMCSEFDRLSSQVINEIVAKIYYEGLSFTVKLSSVDLIHREDIIVVMNIEIYIL